jgi:hypothetical protein
MTNQKSSSFRPRIVRRNNTLWAQTQPGFYRDLGRIEPGELEKFCYLNAIPIHTSGKAISGPKVHTAEERVTVQKPV